MNEPARQEIRRKRITALILGTTIVFGTILFVYALVQQTEAIRQGRIAKQLQVELEQCKGEVAQLKKLQEDAIREANRQRAIAEEHYRSKKK